MNNQGGAEQTWSADQMLGLVQGFVLSLIYNMMVYVRHIKEVNGMSGSAHNM